MLLHQDTCSVRNFNQYELEAGDFDKLLVVTYYSSKVGIKRSKSRPKSTRWVISPSSIEIRDLAAIGTTPHWKEAMCVNFWETIGQLERKKMWSESRTRPIRYWIRRGRHRREIRLDLDVRTLVLKTEIIDDSVCAFSFEYQKLYPYTENQCHEVSSFSLKCFFFLF